MRNSPAIDQASPPRFRVLLLLLILIHLSLAAPRDYDSSYSELKSTYESVTGGSTLTRMQRLLSRCTQRYVTMGFNRKINANGARNAYSVLIFESHGSGGGQVKIKIKGNVTKNYLCFSPKGRLRDRAHGERNESYCMFHEVPNGSFIELQSAANADWKVGFFKRGHKMKGAFLNKNPNCFKFTKLELDGGDPPFLKSGNDPTRRRYGRNRRDSGRSRRDSDR